MSKRFVVKWNGVGYACHDTVADWNMTVRSTEKEAQRDCDEYNARDEEARNV